MTSTTECYYALLDMSNSEQQAYLNNLKTAQPLVYQDVLNLLSIEDNIDSSLTHLIHSCSSELFEERDFTGVVIDKYQIKEKLGQGGIGMVYAANRFNDTYQQDLAIKFIQPSLTHVLGKTAIYQEAQLLAFMNHPYIAKVYDANEHQGFVYMVMEKIEGHTLGQYLKTKIVDAKSALKLFCQICEAVEHAHQHQVIHADIKPENIMVDEQGNPKLLDFNITQKQQVLTNQAASVKAFSKEFASPEQKKGEHLTQQSDVFSLGKLIKVLLNEKTICHELELVIDKATQKNAESRYNSVNALRIDIENYLKSRPISILAHSSWYVIQKLVRRRPIVTTSSLGAFLVSIAFSVALVEQNNQLINEQALTEEMVLELTNIIFHSKSARNLSEMSNMLELTKRQVMANQELPIELKKKMLVMMLAPVPKKQEITSNCEPKCIESQNDE